MCCETFLINQIYKPIDVQSSIEIFEFYSSLLLLRYKIQMEYNTPHLHSYVYFRSVSSSIIEKKANFYKFFI